MAEQQEHPLIRSAIDCFDSSQAKLAQAIGSSQSAVSRMLLRQIPIAAEVAARIDRATGGRVPRHELRPDLWDPPGGLPADITPKPRTPSPAACEAA